MKLCPEGRLQREWTPNLGKYPQKLQQAYAAAGGGGGDGGGRKAGVSLHPTDVLVHKLLGSGREASAEEVDAIIQRVTTTPFAGEVKVKEEFRGASYGDVTLGRTADSLVYHLIQRVRQGQWAKSTTPEQYLDDLRRSASDPSAQIALYERGDSFVGVLAINRTPEERLGDDAFPLLFIVYSADRGRLVSGYGVSSERNINLSEEAVWIRR